jgi:hypothetical protein
MASKEAARPLPSGAIASGTRPFLRLRFDFIGRERQGNLGVAQGIDRFRHESALVDVKAQALGKNAKLARAFRQPGFLKLFDAHRLSRPRCSAPEESETRGNVPRHRVWRTGRVASAIINFCHLPPAGEESPRLPR